jgi:hypothetical protein
VGVVGVVVVVVVLVGVVVVVVGLRPVSVAVGAVPPPWGPTSITWAGGDTAADAGGEAPTTWVAPPLALPPVLPDPPAADPPPAGPPLLADFGGLCPLGTLDGTDGGALMSGRPT